MASSTPAVMYMLQPGGAAEGAKGGQGEAAGYSFVHSGAGGLMLPAASGQLPFILLPDGTVALASSAQHPAAAFLAQQQPISAPDHSGAAALQLLSRDVGARVGSTTGAAAIAMGGRAASTSMDLGVPHGSGSESGEDPGAPAGRKQGNKGAPLSHHEGVKEKNREAQRRFRARQKVLISGLKDTMESMQTRVAKQEQELACLREENAVLRQLLASAQQTAAAAAIAAANNSSNSNNNGAPASLAAAAAGNANGQQVLHLGAVGPAGASAGNGSAPAAAAVDVGALAGMQRLDSSSLSTITVNGSTLYLHAAPPGAALPAGLLAAAGFSVVAPGAPGAVAPAGAGAPHLALAPAPLLLQPPAAAAAAQGAAGPGAGAAGAAEPQP